MSEEVVTVFRLVGRTEPKHPGEGPGQSKWDLLIQPMMVREGSDALPATRKYANGSDSADSAELCHQRRD